ncbi:MAG: hypothetical protein DCC88_05570 [Spirobacillus cienkowskii]|jgi:methyl-accepting chemotaxis protein|uniref:Methyl-accepting transducer domain-containing protein n=1 Tax=Spirobacillus cienkowskii TaxID=495820 RepID=A0A369KRX7_9BACT|nr:MAG: hypothetical protein DCC88_05570 [Spirobacillus cienkowskii]
MIFKKFHLSLRAKIILLFTTILLFLCVFSILQQSKNNNDLMKKMEYILESSSVNLGNAIAAQFYERYGDVQAFAINPVLQENNIIKMQEILNKYCILYGIYDVILFVDLNGNYIASNTVDKENRLIKYENLKKLNFSKESWFTNVLEKKFTEDKENNFFGTYFENPSEDKIIHSVYEKNAYSNSYSAPVYNKFGKIIGVITNRANFSYIENEIKLVHNEIAKQGHPNSIIKLVNKSGLIISEYDKKSEISGEYIRNFDILNIINYFEKNIESVNFIQKQKKGVFYSTNIENKNNMITGYFNIYSSKWIPSINWTVLIESEKNLFFSQINELKNKFIYAIISTGLISLIAFYIILTAINKKFIHIIKNLQYSAGKTFITGKKLHHSSKKMMGATESQSEAMHQSVSAMSEISSMIAQTVNHVKECSTNTSIVNDKTIRGNITMEKLTSSMEEIEKSNTDLKNMARIFSEVTNKTSIINDIVFKTQLLSINASIESARAGQHGKGFSVVAEEVGNLALTSGNAAKEIQILLQESQKQVFNIVDITSKKVADAQEISTFASKEFLIISKEIKSINERLKSISEATKEQQLGVQQVLNAMSKMDQATKQNEASSVKTNKHSKSLIKQGNFVEQMLNIIQILVLGKIKNESKRILKNKDKINNNPKNNRLYFNINKNNNNSKTTQNKSKSINADNNDLFTRNDENENK